jgi:O-succinylbenzoic acid--CoA ligase
METAGPYRIDGTVYGREELMEHGRQILHQPGVPGWRRKVFAFISHFLDTATGPVRQRSSGTTGDPKWFELERESMVNSARKTLGFFGLQPGDTALLCLPVDYVAGKMMVVRALVGGLDLVLAEPSGRPLEGFRGEFGFAAMVPLQLHESLKAGDDLSVIRKLLVGGGEMHPSTLSELSVMSRPEVYESFAMTETCTHFALKRVNGPAPDTGFRLLDGVEIRLDQRGCLVVRVEGVTSGPVVTNDLAEIQQGERSFRWLGRIDNVINTGGIKVAPEILEERIGKLLRADCLVIPRPDEKLGQRLVLLVEWPEEGAPVKSWSGLLRRELAPHEVPKQLVPVGKIPRNASYKPDRKAARELILSRY